VTLDLARWGSLDGPMLARALGAQVPGWPSAPGYRRLPGLLERLRRDPAVAGWLDWLWIRTEFPSRLSVVGSGGFSGRPGPDGVAHFQCSLWGVDGSQGHAAEGARALLRWALRNGANRIVADTLAAQRSSIEILAKVGFRMVGPIPATASVRFEIDQIDDEVSGVWSPP